MQIRQLSDLSWRARRGRRPALRSQPETVVETREVRATAAGYAAVGVDSLDDFYDAYAARAYGLAVCLLPGDRGTAEDIVVETLAAAWRSGSHAGEGSTFDRDFRLLQQIRERCIDVVRGRHGAAGTKAAEYLPPGPSLLMTREGAAPTYQSMRDDLDALSHDQRVSIEEAFFRGRTASQISEDMGIPKRAVHRAMRNGLHVLKGRLLATSIEPAAE